MAAKEFLASTPLSSVLSQAPLVTCTTGCRVEAAIKILDEHSILSLPILAGGEYHGCLSCNDILKELVTELNVKAPHWMDRGAGAFSAGDLLAVGKALTGKTVGELEHAGSLFLLSARSDGTSLLDFVRGSFDVQGTRQHHRVYLCMAAAAAHTVEQGPTTVVNARERSAASGKLAVTHVVSQLDVVRLLQANQGALGGAAQQTLAELGLDEGAVFCVPASTPALEAFARMAADQKSCLGLTDPATGRLVGNLSASDVRCLHSPEAFATLLGPAADLRAGQQGGALTPVGAVTADTTLGRALDELVAHRWHRLYVVDGEGRPTSILTLSDILHHLAG